MSNTVLPSFLMPQEKSLAQIERINENNKLRIGIVKKIIYPDQKENVSKKFIEYDVVVLEQNIHGGMTPVLYKNLVAAESFGSLADFAFYSYRAQKEVKNQKKTAGISSAEQDGAVVLVLFIDGMSNRGVIVGSLGHPDRKLKHEANKHELLFSFNGISFHIKDDGSLEAKFIGKTKNDGSPENKDLGETILAIDAKGGFTLKHKNAELIIAKNGTFSLKNKEKTEINTEKSITYNTKDALTINAEKAITQKAKQDLILEASGNSSLKAKKISMKGESGVEIGGSKIEIKGDSAVNIKGSQIVLDGMVYLGGQGGSPAVTQQTMFVGTGNQGAPVMSQAIGPFSPKVFIT